MGCINGLVSMAVSLFPRYYGCGFDASKIETSEHAVVLMQ